MKYKTVLGGFFVFFIAFGCTFGKGKISVEIVYPEKTLVNPSLTVTAQTAGGSPEEVTSETGERIEISSLEAGNYDLTIRLKDGETVVWEKKISVIVDGAITTKVRYEITEDDFTDFALYAPQIIVTELGENRYRVEIISPNYKGTIRYTMVNPAEDPTASSTEYKAPFEISYDEEQGKVISARVFYKEFDPSEKAVFHLEKTATPQIEDTTVHRLSDKLTFAVTSADPDVIYYYTLDGTTPTTVMSSTEGLIELTQPGTITVKSFKDTYLMSDPAVQPVDRLPKPESGKITENPDGTTYSVTFDYGPDAQAVFLTRDGTSVTAENCPMGNEQSLAAGTTYTVSDLLPTETLKTRSIAENFFASEEAVVESSQAETPVILDARSQTRNYADPLAVMFSTPETDATVYYTFDGNTPTDQSPSSATGTAVEVTGGTTVVKARAYSDGKFPSETAEQAVAKALAPASVSLSYWNLLVVEENASVPATEKNRRLFYQTADSGEFLIYEENTVYLDATAETTVSAVGGAEFCFPSDEVSNTFSLLNAPVPTDARTGSTPAAYLDSLTVDLTGGAADSSSTAKYYVTRNGEEPTRQNAAEETNPQAVTVAAGETLKAVVSDLNKITSASASVDGTPLPEPKAEVADDGTVTITAGASEDPSAAALSFYYKIGDATPFSSTAAGTLYSDTAKPTLQPNETIYIAAAAEMRNPSETASVTLTPTDPPTFEDARGSLFYQPLSVRINGNNVLYAEGADESSVQNPATPYTDPVSPQDGSLWLGATAKDDDKTRSETATRQLFAFDAAPTVSLSHNPPQFNIAEITPPATPTGLTGSVSLYYVLGGDFTNGPVQTYTAPVALPQALLPATADVPVKAVAGAEFARPSAEASQSFTRTEKPTVSDARGTEVYKPLQVTAAAAAPDDTAPVYSSTDETAWTAASSPVTVAENALLYFMAAADGKLTSEPVKVDGTPLNAPEAGVDGDGKLTVTAAAEDAAVPGLEFWYLIGSDDFETGTPTKYETASAPQPKEGETYYIIAAAGMRNPSEAVLYGLNQTDPPVITDNRGGAYNKPLELAVSGVADAVFYYTEGNPAAAPDENSTRYGAPFKPKPDSTEVRAAAKVTGSVLSQPTAQTLYALQGTPTVTLTHSASGLNQLNIEFTDAGYTGGTPTVYYTIDGSDPATSATVQTYSGSVTLPSDQTAPLTVKAVAGAEFCFTTAAAEKTFTAEALPNFTDARNGDYFQPLSVTSADSGVWYAFDNPSSALTAYTANSPLTVGENQILYAFKATDGFLASPAEEIDGTPLAQPQATVTDGNLTFAASDGTVYYTTNGSEPTLSSDQYQGSAVKIDASVTQIRSKAVAEMRNPSPTADYNVETPPEETPEAPTVTDTRTASGAPGSYFNPTGGTGTIVLNVSQAENVPVYYTVDGGNEQTVTGGQVSVTKPGSYVFYAKTAGGTESDKKTVEVKVLQEPKFNYDLQIPSVTLTSSDKAIILYELKDTETAVTSSSPVFTAFDDLLQLPGKTLTAVAVGEFCFSSPQMKEEIPEDLPDPDEPVSPPTVTDTRTASGAPGEYFNPRNGSITLQITAAETAHKLFYKKGSGNETAVPSGGQLSLSQSDAGTYAFYAKSADGSKTSSEVTVEVKVLQKPVLTQNGNTASLSSPDGADILYEVADGSFTPVSESSSVYTSGADLIGKYVSAVAVAEFCFSSEELQQQVPQPPADNVTVSFTNAGGDPVSNGTFREPQNILIVTEPAGATVTYSIGSQSHDQAYTAGTPILIDKSSDIYVKAVTADGKEATAVLKIRLKCPNPTPHLEVSQTDPSKYELTFEETGSDYSIYYTKSIDDSVGTLYPADTPLLLSPEDFVIIFAKKEGWETSDKILLSVPEILKKRGLTD